MLQICPRVPGQSFAEPPFKEEILALIHFFGHSAAIRTLTNVNIKKLYQPWRSFAAIINKCLTGKSSGYDSLRLSQAQILSNTKFQRRAMRCTILGLRRLSSTISCQRIRPFQGGTISIPGVPDVPTDESEEELSLNSTEDEGDNEGKDGDGDDDDNGDDGEEGDGDDDDEDDDGEEGNDDDDDDDDQEVERDDDKDDEEEGGDDEQ
nr:hypothetical protein [Tanacetum cinerariifolium]